MQMKIQQLQIIKQTCIAQETYSRNGTAKNVHVVLKNQPFHITLQLSPPEIKRNSQTKSPFESFKIETQLLYDVADEREVHSLDGPLEYSGKICPENPNHFQLEVRLRALSSQHGDSLFKIRIRAKSADSTSTPLQTTTSEILVISKPDVLRKKNEPRKKRTRDESVLEALTRVEHRLEEQQRQLDRIEQMSMKLLTAFEEQPFSKQVLNACKNNSLCSRNQEEEEDSQELPLQKKMISGVL